MVEAARPEQAEPLVDAVVAALRDLGATVATGRFRAHMQVELTNDGPTTLMINVGKIPHRSRHAFVPQQYETGQDQHFTLFGETRGSVVRRAG